MIRKKKSKLKMVDSHENVNRTKELGDRHLYLFYSMFSQPKNMFEEYKLLTKLIVIGQEPGALEGVQMLQHLEEVWIIDAGLKQEDIGPLCECVGLKRLYLYGNQLTMIPNLTRLRRLAHLWLSDNHITTLQNINSLAEVKELYLGNNNISEISDGIRLKIVCLNLSGNPITNMKEIPKLTMLRNLRWLIFSDPLYKTTPVTLLANFRQFVIYSLPELESLDLVTISKPERNTAAALYDSKLQYYRMHCHSSLSRNFSAQKSNFESKKREFELIWSALHSQGPLNNKTEGARSSKGTFWSAESQRWKERNKQCLDHYKKFSEVTKKRIELELEHSGNLRFIEVNLKDDTTNNHYKTKMNSFICPYLKGKAGEVQLLNVWSVQGPYRTTVLQSQFKDSWDDVFILKPVHELGVAIFQFVEELLFKSTAGREVTVASCFSCVDPLVSDSGNVHRQLLLRSLAVLDSRVLLLCGVTGGSQLFQRELVNTVRGYCPTCCLLPLADSMQAVPLYLVHYQYAFQDYFKQLKESVPVTSVDKVPSQLFPHCSLAASANLTELLIANNNIHSLDIPVMEHVTVVDVSYNHLSDLSSIGRVFPNLTSLDLSFNRLSSLESLQEMKGLSQLLVKWNFLTDFRRCLQKLKAFTSLKHLDLSWNPFFEVVCHEKEQHLISLHLKTLLSFNGFLLLRSSVPQKVMPLERDQFLTVPAWQGPQHCLTLKWKTEMSDQGNHLGIVADHILSVTLQGNKLTHFSLSFPLTKIKWLDLSHNLISSSVVLKALVTLEEVNLSYNVMEVLSDLKDKFKCLTRMNLSHNCISSLVNFRPKSFPNLKLLDLSNNCIESLAGMCGAKSLVELYLSHNQITDCATLVNCKTWTELRVLDLSDNPLSHSSTLRQNCLYYNSALKYINGSRVDEEEVKSAMALYGGLLDKNYLLKVYSKPDIANLTILNLTKCSIEKVSFPDASFDNIISVILDHNKICSLSWLGVFPNLKRLSMSHNRVRSYYEQEQSSSALCLRSVQPHSLTSLVLSHNAIRDLQPLRLDLFPQLKLLMLNDNEISSLCGLKKNSELERLVIDRNKLRYIRINEACELVNLTELYVEHNSLTQLQFLSPLKKLHKLFVGFNKLVDKSCLDCLRALPELRELTVHGNPLFRRTGSYRDYLPDLPSLQLLEGHPVTSINHIIS